MEELKVNAIMEIMGVPKDHVIETLKELVSRLKMYDGIEVLEEKSHEPIEKALGTIQLWSTFVEVDLKVKNVDRLIAFSFDFMPSSIEIYDPEEIKFSITDTNNLFNDLITRLHQYDMRMKNIHAQNIVLKQELEKKK